MGFLGSAFSAQNQTKVQPVQGMANTYYGDALQQAMRNGQQTNAAQSNYAAMLQSEANGGGPNLANAQLQQATDQNIKQAAGQIGSQKGINPALQARLIGNQTANLNQQAGQQSSVNRMEEQLAAQQQLGNVYQQQAQNALSAGGTYGGLQQGQNSGLIQSQLGQQGLQEDVSKQNTGNQQASIGYLSGALSAGGSGGAKALAYGGYVPAYADGGLVNYVLSPYSGIPRYDPNAGKDLGQAGNDVYKRLTKKSDKPGELKADDEDITSDVVDDGISGAGEEAGGAAGAGEGAAAGTGEIAAGEGAAAAEGASDLGLLALASQGGKIGGRAQVSGDSLQNDKVPAMLSPGEVVIPRSASDTPDHAKEFMEALEKANQKGGKVEYKHVLAAQKNLHDRISAIERLACGGYAGGMK